MTKLDDHPSLTIENRRHGDGPARQDLSRHAFAKASAFDPDMPRVEPERDLCAYVGDRLVGAAACFESEQVFGGRPVPMGAVGAVIVLPEFAGRGVGTRLLDESFERMRDRGEVISTQFPTRPGFYRRLGYGTGGTLATFEVDLTDLPAGDPRRPVRELGADELGVVRQIHDQVALDYPGWVRFGRQHWDRLTYRFEASPLAFAYAIEGDDGSVSGVVVYRLDLDRPDPRVTVDLLAAADPESWRALLSILRWNSPAASRLEMTLPAELLFALLPGVASPRVLDHRQWMTRIVDLPGAIEARGWSPAVEAEIHLHLVDPTDPGWSAYGIVRVDEGKAWFEQGGRGDIELDRADFASIYTGWLGATQARALGRLVEHRVGAVEALAGALPTGTPSGVHHF